jgi:hypothetical protein
MRAHLLLLVGGLILGGLSLVGCEKEDATTATPPAPQESPAAQPAGGALDKAAQDAAGTLTDAKKQAAGAVESAKEAGAEATSTIQNEAQKLLDQATQYIKENKFELADQTIAKLEGMKAQLPQTMQDAIGKARSALDTAKKAQGMMPGGAAPK